MLPFHTNFCLNMDEDWETEEALGWDLEEWAEELEWDDFDWEDWDQY